TLDWPVYKDTSLSLSSQGNLLEFMQLIAHAKVGVSAGARKCQRAPCEAPDSSTML
ncbi:Uncharacterized protein DAT39_020071, partial [Clarias magur]